jgi:CheY-like chemotaxis protein
MERRETGGGLLRGSRVLIVEDEFLIALEMEMLLRDEGCTVLGPVNSVDRALELIDREQPDAALLDLNLNGVMSTPIAAELEARHVPFVTVTAYAQDARREPELAGAPRVDKPIRHGELMRVLSGVLRTT